MTPDGKYTNAVYGFLAILFKVLDDLQPEYLAVTFDLKAPTARHKMYEGYKANRKGMPNELAEQMPIVKEILRDMNIMIIEKEGYEADDIMGTLAKRAEKEGLEVTIVSGDRDTFQLASEKITIRIPHTKLGKTETDEFDKAAIIEKYGVTPKQLIEVKGLMGDNSDNIPGVPGIGEKTALELIKKYHSIEQLYEQIEKNEDDLKGKIREKIATNKELAELSKTLGTINLQVPIEQTIEDLLKQEWNQEKVLAKFQELHFNRFIERFGLEQQAKEPQKTLDQLFTIETIKADNVDKIQEIIQNIKASKKMIYFLGKKEVTQEKNVLQIIPKRITSLSIYIPEKNLVYFIKIENEKSLKNSFAGVLEDSTIQKYGHHLSEDYCLLQQENIALKGIYFDSEIAAYDLNPSNNHYDLEELASQYLGIDTNTLLSNFDAKTEETQLNLFQMEETKQKETVLEKNQNALMVYIIGNLIELTFKKLEKINSFNLFNEIEMPLVEVLGSMQYTGIKANKEELINFGNQLKEKLQHLTQEIYGLCGEEFNVNSTQQLGSILFEKLQLPVYKKTKKGYSTDVDILEKLKGEHPVIEKILEYRSLTKLNSTYVAGLIPYIHEQDGCIHSYFHQTITATGRISSTEPNLQNIPARMELGKQIRKAFVAKEGYVFIDADYSQIELRVLAHISKDETMRQAFFHDEDIHRQVASRVFDVPFEEVTKEQRTAAKAVNFGIVYGISSFGLSEQLSIGRKKAEQYINQYMTKYEGVKKFMDDIVEEAKEKGYVETLFHRRRYIPELSSNNYMVRQFGARAAMNTPIQGTAADIMKIAMIKVFQKLQEEKLDAKLILQIHDELLIECKIEEKEKVKTILQDCMENAIQLEVPLKVEVSEADNWYDVK